MVTEYRKAMISSTFLESKNIAITKLRGGCALVWLARSQATGDKVALKQFPKQNKGLDSTA